MVRTRPLALAAPWLAISLALPGVALAQDATVDSTAIADDMRDRQEEFERFRESRIPVSASSTGGCDERIGRLCIWFGGENETDFPPEPSETSRARIDLIQDLSDAWDLVKDPWILGQLVHYLTESGGTAEAERRARECGLVDAAWWCDALLGYALHIDGRFVESEAAFRDAVAAVPAEEEERWRTPWFVVSPDGEDRFAELAASSRPNVLDMFWDLSDPLFLVEGNDRLTEHYTRVVLARIREDAENPYGLAWADDLEESLIRYGRHVGWSRSIRIPVGLAAPADPRSIVGHHDPNSRGYLFPEEFIEAPADVVPESWVTAPRESRTWYTAPYAPDFRGLETQVARFRRGDEMLVVAAYRPSPPELDPFAGPEARPEPARRNPFAPRDPAPAASTGPSDATGPVEAGFFLVPESGGEFVETRGAEREGVVTLTAPTGRYVSSVEVFEPAGERAWRARQGVSQDPLVRGLVGVSDLLVLREGAPFPETIEEAIPLARPGIRIGADERFTVAWEVYGLEVDQPVQVTVGFTTGRPGFLTRVGSFLGIVEPDEPVEISFEDAGAADGVQTLFRAVTLQLPDLDAGEYTLHLQLDVQGREPTIASRPIIVGP